LAALGVRIEAPIPGKAAVGVEVPNKVLNIVNMRELISSQTFESSKSKLTVVLGRDISGKIVISDLAKMPHLLIAGSTGSGKSVCINSFIISLLYKASPEEIELLMIDPKIVELGIYNKIPHLLAPVVTDPSKAACALNWAVNEMSQRYNIFAQNGVRDISSYNQIIANEKKLQNSAENSLKKMTQIVIIIDELSDLMMAAPNEIEDYICRLAQMARAAGIHLVIATQRPSVDVITGTIKANIPSRIALAVSSQIDSRTILDMCGAEKLLGRGDMLFSLIGNPKPIRIQGCYVADSEIERIVKFVKKSQTCNYNSDLLKEIEKNVVSNQKKKAVFVGRDELLFKEAVKCVVSAGIATNMLIQNKLKIRLPQVKQLLEEMEKRGIVGPADGFKPRKVLISSYHQFLESTPAENNEPLSHK
jgi:S-DNA-T family DNA segregation ATPase FtsK/SpoIIIE